MTVLTCSVIAKKRSMMVLMCSVIAKKHSMIVLKHSVIAEKRSSMLHSVGLTYLSLRYSSGSATDGNCKSHQEGFLVAFLFN